MCTKSKYSRINLVTMNLYDLGYNNIKAIVDSLDHLSGFELGRIIAEHKERYLVATAKGEVEAEIAWRQPVRQSRIRSDTLVQISLFDRVNMDRTEKGFPREKHGKIGAAKQRGNLNVLTRILVDQL